MTPDERPGDVNNSDMAGGEKNLSPVVDGREICPVCGRILESKRCKLVCECGYFMSCAEF
jgi:hypothetical protein